MSGCNRVVILGNLTRDPEIRKTPTGAPVGTLGVAASDTYRNQKGESVERTCFVEVVTWGAQAENCGKYLKKGSPVLVDGRLQYDEWEGKDGERRNKLRVRADSVQFLGTKGPAKANAAPPAHPEPKPVATEEPF